MIRRAIPAMLHRTRARGPSAVNVRPRQRLVMAVAAAACVAGGAVSAAVPATAAGSTLRAAAEAQGKYFGTEVTGSMINNTTITNLAAQQFDMVTPGNEMKWDTTEPSNGSYNFGPGDAIVSFARAHGMRVRGHNLVWQNQLPSWVSSLPLNQVQQAMENHITAEVSHYKGEIYSWDVVNEPFNGDGSLVNDVFYQAMGSGYIADALRTAHAADPSAQLYLNDFNIEGENAKSNAMYSLVQSLLAQGVPINGVGFESHYIVGQVPSSLLANMQRFAALGVNVAVTELDDRIQLPATTATLNQQAHRLRHRRARLPAGLPLRRRVAMGRRRRRLLDPRDLLRLWRGHHVRPELPAQARLQRRVVRPGRLQRWWWRQWRQRRGPRGRVGQVPGRAQTQHRPGHPA